MYLLYNCRKGDYTETKYQSFAIACQIATTYSAIFRCRYYVISADTGEILKAYDMGLIMKEV